MPAPPALVSSFARGVPLRLTGHGKHALCQYVSEKIAILQHGVNTAYAVDNPGDPEIDNHTRQGSRPLRGACASQGVAVWFELVNGHSRFVATFSVRMR